jgi:hypothetical protein
MAIITKDAKSDLSNLQKGPSERFNHSHLLTVHRYPPWVTPCQHREKVIEQFLNK